MYKLEDIRDVHLEISSRCNARCPFCPRSFFGAALNMGYPEQDMTLARAERVFAPEFIQQLQSMSINGNFGDIVMNPDAVPILEYFRQHNPSMSILISTNGGARASDFWQALARLNCSVDFCIDGLEDTHHLYRRNTRYETVIKNAETFIQAGGFARWKMIKFDYNIEQRTEARQRSQKLGFARFLLVDSPRTEGPVFDDEFNLEYTLGKPTETRAVRMLADRLANPLTVEHLTDVRHADSINCEAKRGRSIYVTSTGEVYPCCYLGFAPRTFGRGSYLDAVNHQVQKIIQPNSAVEHSLSQAIEWFNRVEESWSKPTVQQGRLLACNDQCGVNND